MKRIAILFVLALVSCSKLDKDLLLSNQEGPLQTRAENDKSDEYFVNKSDVMILLGDKRKVREIREYPSNDCILFYAVSLDSCGFYLVSADKRATPIIAYSETSKFDDTIEGFDFIVNEYSAPIKAIKSSSHITEPMQYNIDTWRFITTRIKRMPCTKSSNMVYFYYIGSEDIIIHANSHGPLLQTNWGQSNKNDGDCYWNYYCPYSSTSLSGNKCPVGCVAVAGGQFAYYMRYRYDVSIGVPETASCTGYSISEFNHNYTQSFSLSQSYDYIDEMPLDYHENNSSYIEHVRIFLAYIGKTVDMQYAPDGSTAYPYRLVNLMNGWNIRSSYIDFDSPNSEQMLRNDTPVIVRANSQSEGHCWVIDGFQTTYLTRRNYYYSSFDELDDSQISALTMEDWNGAYEDWDMPITTLYHMNWGWNGYNNGWFSSGNWTISGESYSSGKSMISCHQFEYIHP